MIKNKNKLKEIAKRHAKGILKATDNSNFMDSGLTEDEISYVAEHVREIGDRITEKDPLWDSTNVADILKL